MPNNVTTRPHPSTAAAAPSYPAEDGAACRCGAGRHLALPGRCARAHPLTGHGGDLSRRHDLYVPLARASEREAFMATSVAEDGGPSEIGVRRHALHEYRGRLHGHIRSLSDALDHFGLFDKRGRLRGLWLQRLEGLITTAHRLDGTLGLDRRAKRVPSLAEFIEQHTPGETP